MQRKGLPDEYRRENLPPPNTKGHGLLLSASQSIVPRPFENLRSSDYRVDTHSFHLFIEEMCRTIANQEIVSTFVTDWNSTLTHLYYGILLMYRVICAKIEAGRATDDERLFIRIFETRLGVDHIIPQPLIPYFIHLGAVRLTDAYGIISPRGPEFAQNTNRAINLDQRGICKIPCFPLLAFFLDSLARANQHCIYDVEDNDSLTAGFPQANFQFAGLNSNNPAHYSRIISTPGFYKMLVHKSSDYVSTRRYLRNFNEAEIRGNVASTYQSLVDYLPFDWRNENASFSFFKNLTEMHRELGKYYKSSISLSAIDAAGTRTSLVETYTLDRCAHDDLDYAIIEERTDDDEPEETTAADTAKTKTRKSSRSKKKTPSKTRAAEVIYRQPNTTELNRHGITPLDPGFRYRILYKLTDYHEIATGAGISFILTGPNLHASLQADLRGPYFVDADEDHDNNQVSDPLRYQLYKMNAEHPAYHARNRVSRMFRRAFATIDYEILEKVPTIETLETAKSKVRIILKDVFYKY